MNIQKCKKGGIMTGGEKFDKDKKKISRIVRIVTLDGAVFSGEITGSNSRGIFIRPDGAHGFSNSVFISHRAISHLEDLGWQR